MSATPPNPGARPTGGSRGKPGLMRNLGQFFGHIVKGVKSDPGPNATAPAQPRTAEQGQLAPQPPPARIITRAETVEHALPGPDGASPGVILRRTVIDEVEFGPPAPATPGTSPAAPDRSP